MSWKYNELNEKLQTAIDVLGAQKWEAAFKDSDDKQYRVLKLEDVSREEEREIQAALDALIIIHTQKPMAPYKGAPKSDYAPVIKVFNWRSIDNITKLASNQDLTVLEIEEAVKRSAALTCFERVFANQDDFLSFQEMLDNGEIRDHVNGGLVLKLDLSNTTVEGLLEIFARSGLDTKLINFSFDEGPESVFVPNEAFPPHIRPVTVYES